MQRSMRLARLAAALVGVSLIVATATPAAADHRRGGGGWSRGGGGGWHGHAFVHNHFHSFVFVGAGFGAYYPSYYSPYPAHAYPVYAPPPVYVSPTECYQPPVPRSPGVADLYTCGGQYVGAISVP